MFQCDSLSLPNGFAVLPDFAAVFCVFPESEMACLLFFPFLRCLPSYFSMGLLFYNYLPVLGHAMTAHVCIFFLLENTYQMCFFEFDLNSLEVDCMSG